MAEWSFLKGQVAERDLNEQPGYAERYAQLTGHVVSVEVRRHAVELLYGDGRIAVIEAVSASREPEIRIRELRTDRP